MIFGIESELTYQNKVFGILKFEISQDRGKKKLNRTNNICGYSFLYEYYRSVNFENVFLVSSLCPKPNLKIKIFALAY